MDRKHLACCLLLCTLALSAGVSNALLDLLNSVKGVPSECILPAMGMFDGCQEEIASTFKEFGQKVESISDLLELEVEITKKQLKKVKKLDIETSEKCCGSVCSFLATECSCDEDVTKLAVKALGGNTDVVELLLEKVTASCELPAISALDEESCEEPEFPKCDAGGMAAGSMAGGSGR